MKVSRSLLCLGAAGALFAQTPPPKPAAPGQPTISLSVEKPPATVPPDRVVISAGEVKITAAQFDEIVDSLPEQTRAAVRGPARRQFGDQLVRILVLAQEGKKRKLDESPKFKVQSMVQIDNMLAGVTFGEITKDIKISDADLHTYYDAHKSEYEEARAKHILIRVQGAPMPVKPGQKDLTDAEALAKAQEVRKKIAGGGDFAALALAESDDTTSAASGGDLGVIKRGMMTPAFEEAVFAMKPGELSEPVKTPYGYHIIQMQSRTVGKSFEEVRPDLEKKMRPEAAQKALDELVKSTVMDPEFFGLAK